MGNLEEPQNKNIKWSFIVEVEAKLFCLFDTVSRLKVSSILKWE